MPCDGGVCACGLMVQDGMCTPDPEGCVEVDPVATADETVSDQSGGGATCSRNSYVARASRALHQGCNAFCACSRNMRDHWGVYDKHRIVAMQTCS